jgi:phosphoribosylaminoimidazolecarboxamide formyltransferase/IMP cyclohydrolase
LADPFRRREERKQAMNELQLKYGCNPNQKPSRIYMADGRDLPIQILNGRPGYINFMDALNGWQLVTNLKQATGLPAAASFKHVSPAGAAVGLPLPDVLKKIYWVEEYGDLSPLACAYARARGADRMSSFGDFISLSDVCDEDTAMLIRHEVSDGVIAPGYTEKALEILKEKKKGGYVVIQMDPEYVPEPLEHRQIFGITFEQGRQELAIDDQLLSNIVTENKTIPAEAMRDLKISLITLKYTQSNSVCYVKDGQAIGVGAGQQSRVHCTRLAGGKADNWWLRQSPRVLELPFLEEIARPNRDNAIDVYIGNDSEDVLRDGEWQKVFKVKPDPFTAEQKREWLDKMTGVSLGSDAFFPFSDNIERAVRSGVKYIAEPGGSIRDKEVIDCCDRYGIAMAFTGIRLFHH